MKWRSKQSGIRIGLLAMVAVAAVGCQGLLSKDRASNSGIVLPDIRMEPDSVAVRVAVVEIDETQKDLFRQFVETTDPQKLPLSVRQRLDENGLQAAVVSSVNSRNVHELLSPLKIKEEWLQDHQRHLARRDKLPEVSRMKTHRHIEKKRGQSFVVATSPNQSSTSWSVHSDGGHYVDHALMAEANIRITAWPQEDGRVKFDFLPEVHHGQNQARFSTSGRDLTVSESRDVKPLHSLAFSATLRRGETILIAPTENLERSGKLLFQAGKLGENVVSAEVAQQTEDSLVQQFFPTIEKESQDAEILVESAEIGELNIETLKGPPKPWQRFMLIRLVDVTPPAVSVR